MEEVILNIIKDINPYMNVDNKTKLLEEDILDSMSLLLLITELENKYSVEIPLEDLQLEYFTDVDHIISFINDLKEK